MAYGMGFIVGRLAITAVGGLIGYGIVKSKTDDNKKTRLAFVISWLAVFIISMIITAIL